MEPKCFTTLLSTLGDVDRFSAQKIADSSLASLFPLLPHPPLHESRKDRNFVLNTYPLDLFREKSEKPVGIWYRELSGPGDSSRGGLLLDSLLVLSVTLPCPVPEDKGSP